LTIIFSRKKICLTGCRYDVVGRVALELGFKCVQEYDLWDIIWSDAPLPNERVTEMRRIQVSLKSFIDGQTHTAIENHLSVEFGNHWSR